jgi:pimeloyl-ACP methyl ester carboxylesterase
MSASSGSPVRNVALVHGGFVDGSGWEGVYKILKKNGFNVTIVQNPTISLAGDVEVTKRALAAQDGETILVGHSYGGVVITEAGNDSKVAGLVYIAAFAPDRGESVSSLIQNPPLARRCRRSCHPRTDSCSSTRRNSRLPSRPM